MGKTPDETLKEIYDWMMKQFIEHCAGSPPMKICPDTCHCSCHDKSPYKYITVDVEMT